jgi:Circularly permutated YpsA SLOG family
LLKIISGGQTGVDRGALDAALKFEVECGGCCPAGRLAEDGRIPVRYPVAELPNASYSERTKRNVSDADGTLIICKGELSGGTRETLEFCRERGKPHLVIDVTWANIEEAIARATEFVEGLLARERRNRSELAKVSGLSRDPSTSLGMTVLNVAGPRASQWPEAHEITRQIISAVLRRLSGHEGVGEYSEPDSPRGEF